MADPVILTRVRVNLGYPDRVPDGVMEDLIRTIDAAKCKLKTELGIDIDERNPQDCDLLTAYSLYRYRHRDSDREMPRSLRLDLNDRKVATAAEGGA